MRLSEAHRFVRVKKLAPDVIGSIPREEKNISNINKVLRKCFIGNGVDSIRAFEKSDNMLIIKTSYKGVRLSFITSKFTLKEKAINELIVYVRNIIWGVQNVTT